MNIEILAALRSQPWALRPEFLQSLAMHTASSGVKAAPAKRPTTRGANGIAVIPLIGPVNNRAGFLSSILGWTDWGTFSAQLKAALDDDSIGQILIEVDSPGGSVYGTAEAAKAVYQARLVKPVVAVANSQAASAAYWVASQADEFFVTPGGEVGSIGVYSSHEDVSKALADAGVNVTLISAGKYKTEGHPYGPLGPETQQFMQSRVDDYYAMFVRDVARGRGVTVDKVRRDMGQGRMFGADAALAADMVDGVMTRDQVVQRMVRAGRVHPAARQAQRARSSLQAARNELRLAGDGPRRNLQAALNKLRIADLDNGGSK